MTLDDAASQRQHASDIADSDVVKYDPPSISQPLVIQLIELAIAREREACAKLVEERYDGDPDYEHITRDIAAAIRARP